MFKLPYCGLIAASSLSLCGELLAQDENQTPSLPSSPCCISQCHTSDHFYLQVEGLYWKATEDNTSFVNKEFASVTVAQDSSSETILETDNRAQLDFRWDPGLRINLGFLLPTQQWDINIGWTYFVTHTPGSASAPDLAIPSEGKGVTSGTATTLEPTWLAAEDVEEGVTEVALGNVNDIHADWHLCFNNIEATFGQTFCNSSYSKLRFYAGPKFVHIVQKYHFSYLRLLLEEGGLSGAGNASQTIKSYYNAYGLQGGLEANWLLGWGFTIYSNFGGGFTYGHVHIDDYEKIHTEASDSHEQFYETEHNKTNLWVTRPNIDLTLGLAWEYCFSDSYLLALKAGWEFHNYFDQNFLRLSISDDPARGNLALQGVTFGVGFGF